MIACSQCKAPLEGASKFCPDCGARIERPTPSAPSDEAAAVHAKNSADGDEAPIRLELNRNRIYMKDHRGFVEIRLSSFGTESIQLRLLLQSSPPGLLGESGAVTVRLTGVGTRIARLPLLPGSSGELLFGLTSIIERPRQGRIHLVSEQQFLKVYSPTASAQNLAISIDNSVSSSGDMSGISNRTQSDLGKQVRELVRGGATINELLDQQFPNRWERIELYRDDDHSDSPHDDDALEFDRALGIVAPIKDGESELRQAVWEVIADGQITAEEKARLDEIIRTHGISSVTASTIVKDVRAEEKSQRAQLAADVDKRSKAVLRNGLEPYLNAAVAKRLPDWQRWAALGWPAALMLLADCLCDGIGIEKDEDQARANYERAAQQADCVAAKTAMGWMYENGYDAYEDDDGTREFDLYAEAAAAGDLRAKHDLARLYENGIGTVEDIPKAVELYGQAAKGGVVDAMVRLAQMCEAGEHVEQDSENAVAWYRNAAEAGDSDAMFQLAFRLDGGGGAGFDAFKDPVEARQWWSQAVDAGAGSIAMFNLGCNYRRDGQHVEAFKWLLASANAGYANAMEQVALRLEDGEGIKENPSEAASWFRRGAEAGNLNSMTEWADRLVDGTVVAKDDAAALAWYRKAAEAGHPSGAGGLGFLYFYGMGTVQDFQQAAHWFRLGADRGDASSMDFLGDCYRDGHGVQRDVSQAVTWYRKAAEMEYGPAMISLALHYRTGSGVARDLVQARSLLDRAQAVGEDVSEPLQQLQQLESEPSVEFKSIKVEHDVVRNDRDGIKICVHIVAEKLLHQPCYVAAYFEHADGRPLIDTNGLFRSDSGQVSVGTSVEPPYISSHWESFTFFISHAELHLSASTQCRLRITWFLKKKDAFETFASSDYVYFDYRA